MVLADFVTEAEYSDALDGVKDLLKETYELEDHEVSSVIGTSLDIADEYLHDYIQYVQYIHEIRQQLKGTLESQLQQKVDQEQELHIRMRNDAAVWLTFECVRRICRKSMLNIY
jgi:RNA binding exosome subunit